MKNYNHKEEHYQEAIGCNDKEFKQIFKKVEGFFVNLMKNAKGKTSRSKKTYEIEKQIYKILGTALHKSTLTNAEKLNIRALADAIRTMADVGTDALRHPRQSSSSELMMMVEGLEILMGLKAKPNKAKGKKKK